MQTSVNQDKKSSKVVFKDGKFKVLHESVLSEASAKDEFIKEMKPEDKTGDSVMEILDHCAEEAEMFYFLLNSAVEAGDVSVNIKQTNKYNPIFVGPTGSAKTSMITTWAHERGYDIVTINMMGEALDFLGVKNIDPHYSLVIDDKGTTKETSRVTTIPTKAFDAFLHGTTKILFLDEINKTNPTILQSLYDLISFHTIQNGDDVMSLPKLLFTVGAMNPTEYGGGRVELDPALKARMMINHVNYDTAGLKKYLLETLDWQIKAAVREGAIAQEKDNEQLVAKIQKAYLKRLGQKDLIESVFADVTKFRWTAADVIADADELEPILVPRTFDIAISNCDGTKNDFLKYVQKYCGLEGAQEINEILANYRDKDHKANLIWDKDYSVKEEPRQEESEINTWEEDEIVARASDADKQGSELNTNWYRKLQNARNK